MGGGKRSLRRQFAKLWPWRPWLLFLLQEAYALHANVPVSILLLSHFDQGKTSEECVVAKHQGRRRW